MHQKTFEYGSIKKLQWKSFDPSFVKRKISRRVSVEHLATTGIATELNLCVKMWKMCLTEQRSKSWLPPTPSTFMLESYLLTAGCYGDITGCLLCAKWKIKHAAKHVAANKLMTCPCSIPAPPNTPQPHTTHVNVHPEIQGATGVLAHRHQDQGRTVRPPDGATPVLPLV